MSWLRSAVNIAVDGAGGVVGGAVGGANQLTRTVRGYADTVVSQAGQAGQAVVGGAKLLHDRLAAKNLQSFKHALKTLEEVSVSYRGIERVQLLRRWLVSLKEVERLSAAVAEKESDPLSFTNESKDSPAVSMMVLYYDTDHGGEPMNFRDVFLLSQALEGITLNMILEAPSEEEAALLREIFKICLMGGTEVQDSTLRCIRDLAKLFSMYKDEILAKREELLQYAQGAIAGLKINANIVRINCEISNIHQNLDEKSTMLTSGEGNEQRPETQKIETEEDMKELLARVQLCSKLQGLLLKKKNIDSGDPPDIYAQKVDKLKVLVESLSTSAAKSEKRMSDQRGQQEEAVKYRAAKANEVSQHEKDLEVEVEGLEEQLKKLEFELRKVKTSLGSARARLQNAREEREQFNADSNGIILQLKSKEVELSRSVSSFRTEANVCKAFINFLEDCWRFHSSFNEQKMKQVDDEMKKHEEFFLNLAIHILSAFKDELDKSMSTFRNILEKLQRPGTADSMHDWQMDAPNPRKRLEEEYINTESQLITTLSVVESIKKQFDEQETSRKNDPKVMELFEALDKLASDFESVKRPTLEVETPRTRTNGPSTLQRTKSTPVSPRGDRIEKSVSANNITDDSQKPKSLKKSLSVNLKQNAAESQGRCVSPSVKGTRALEAKLSKLKIEMDFDEHDGDDYHSDDIGDWEFDAIHR